MLQKSGIDLLLSHNFQKNALRLVEKKNGIILS